jgi:hypothetical protein
LRVGRPSITPAKHVFKQRNLGGHRIKAGGIALIVTADLDGRGDQGCTSASSFFL